MKRSSESKRVSSLVGGLSKAIVSKNIYVDGPLIGIRHFAPIMDGLPSQFKPMSQKQKTCQYGPGLGYLCTHKDFIRKGSSRINTGSPTKPIPKSQFTKTRLKMSLRRLLSDMLDKKYSVEKKVGRRVINQAVNMYDINSLNVVFSENSENMYIEFKLSDEYYNSIKDNYDNIPSSNTQMFRLNLSNFSLPDYNISNAEVQEQLMRTFRSFPDKTHSSESPNPTQTKSNQSSIQFLVDLVAKDSNELNYLHPIEYRQDDTQPYISLRVFGDPPITGDADPFAICPTQNEVFKLMEENIEEAKTLNQPALLDLNQLLVKIDDLSYDAIDTNPDIPPDMDLLAEQAMAVAKNTFDMKKYCQANFNKHTAGIATPYEFKYLALIIKNILSSSDLKNVTKTSPKRSSQSSNKHANQFMERFASMIQHGPETNNPGKASDLDDTVVWFWHGQEISTHTEEEHIQFIMGNHPQIDSQHAPVDEIFIKIHPAWSMEKGWAEVIDRQAESWASKFQDKHHLSTHELDALKGMKPSSPASPPQNHQHRFRLHKPKESSLKAQFTEHMDIYYRSILPEKTLSNYNQYNQQKENIYSPSTMRRGY